MSTEPRPVIQADDASDLAGVHTVVIDAWPDLRWIVIAGTGRAIPLSTSVSKDEIKARATEAFEGGDREAMNWSEVLDVVLDAIGVPTLLQEIADLTAQRGHQS